MSALEEAVFDHIVAGLTWEERNFLEAIWISKQPQRAEQTSWPTLISLAGSGLLTLPDDETEGLAGIRLLPLGMGVVHALAELLEVERAMEGFELHGLDLAFQEPSFVSRPASGYLTNPLIGAALKAIADAPLTIVKNRKP